MMAEKKDEKKAERSFEEGAKKRILIVDDDAELAKLLASFFSKAGFETRYSVKGKDGLEAFRELKPHLVLLDMLLPDIMGLEVLKQMKQVQWAEKTRFIAMSAIMKDQRSVSEIKNKHGAHEFLEKPFQVKELNNTVAKHLGMELEKPKAVKPPPSAAPNKPVKAPTIPEPNVPLEAGDLRTADLPRILSAFFTARVTGVLKVGRDQVVKAIYFEDGKPIFAASQDPTDRLGETMIRNGYLTRPQLEEALAKSSEASRLGTTLIDMGLLTQSGLFSLIQLQVREIIFSVFSWTHGQYAFHFEDLASREMIKLQTPVADIVLEGVRRYFTQERLMEMLVNKERVFYRIPNPQFLLQDLHLSGSDKKIFDLIDGKRSIAKILQDAKQPEINILQVIYALWAMKIITDEAKR